MSDKLSNDILWWKPNNRPLPEEYKIKHMKTHAEFLEELKVKMKKDFEDESFTINWRSCCYDYYKKIEQFESQLRGDKEKDNELL